MIVYTGTQQVIDLINGYTTEDNRYIEFAIDGSNTLVLGKETLIDPYFSELKPYFERLVPIEYTPPPPMF